MRKFLLASAAVTILLGFAASLSVLAQGAGGVGGHGGEVGKGGNISGSGNGGNGGDAGGGAGGAGGNGGNRGEAGGGDGGAGGSISDSASGGAGGDGGTAASSYDDLDPHPIIDGEFEIQPYLLPNGQGYRHLTSMINQTNDELVLFGGLGDGPPSPPTPMNHKVYTLDLAKAPSEQEWHEESTDVVIPEPWFTTTRGFVEFGDRAYLACDDSEVNGVYTFDPVTYTFDLLSESTLDPQFKTSDCCAVGVTIRNRSGDDEKGEERIYLIGGGNDFASPLPYVRYYSITHDRWERVADLNLSRRHMGCASVKQRGKPLIYAIAGGDETTGEALRSIELYDVLDDEWTLYDDFFPEGGGRTRMSVQSVDDEYLLVIGGDATCTGGLCPPDRALTTVDIIDIRSGNRLISSDEHVIPQLNAPRQTPATSLRKSSDHDQEHRYVLHVVAGRTIAEDGGTDVLTTTEVLSFDRIKVGHQRPARSSRTSSLMR